MTTATTMLRNTDTVELPDRFLKRVTPESERLPSFFLQRPGEMPGAGAGKAFLEQIGLLVVFIIVTYAVYSVFGEKATLAFTLLVLASIFTIQWPKIRNYF